MDDQNPQVESPHGPPRDFQTLLERARKGDVAAMESLAREYESEVRLVARVRLGAALRPHLDSLDLVQSVHRSLLLGLRNNRFDISSPDKLIGLAVTMVRRKIARKWRRIRRQKRLSSGGGSSGVPDGDPLPDLILSLACSDPDPVVVAETKEQLEKMFERMDDTERSLIELRLEGCTTAEAARSLGQDPDVLRVKLSRLRKKLQNLGLLSDWL